MDYLTTTIELVAAGLSLVVLADIIVSFVVSPLHPVRRVLDNIVNPMLAPIRRFLPPIGMLDFSPVVLIILVQLIKDILIRVLVSLR